MGAIRVLQQPARVNIALQSCYIATLTPEVTCFEFSDLYA